MAYGTRNPRPRGRMPKLLPVFLLFARLASPMGISFTEVEVSFDASGFSISNSATTVATCDLPVGVCPNGNFIISGLIPDAPLVTIGDYYSQSFLDGNVTFVVDGEESLIAQILFGSLTKWTDENFFAQAEILSPLWAERFGTNLLGISMSLPDGSLQVANKSFDAFRSTSQLHAYPMYEDPGGHLPEPGTFALTGVAGLGALCGCWRHRRRLS